MRRVVDYGRQGMKIINERFETQDISRNVIEELRYHL